MINSKNRRLQNYNGLHQPSNSFTTAEKVRKRGALRARNFYPERIDRFEKLSGKVHGLEHLTDIRIILLSGASGPRSDGYPNCNGFRWSSMRYYFI